MWTCDNEQCLEFGIGKRSDEPMPPGSEVHCGGCGEFCSYSEPPAPTG